MEDTEVYLEWVNHIICLFLEIEGCQQIDTVIDIMNIKCVTNPLQ